MRQGNGTTVGTKAVVICHAASNSQAPSDSVHRRSLTYNLNPKHTVKHTELRFRIYFRTSIHLPSSL